MGESMNKDKRYLRIVNDILGNEEFLKLKDIVHHGMNRYDHSARVSYYSYKVAKALKLEYKDVARGGLLHDFFLDRSEDMTIKDKMHTLYHHPKYALEKSKEYFVLNEKEEDIILSHMFPVSFRAPRFLESWLVDMVDNCVSVYEKAYVTRLQLSTAFNVLFFFVINYVHYLR